jgi:alpha-tubulin suppressor-like RCC1 family protein
MGLWDNSGGQLGDGTTIDRTSLVKVADGIKAITTGYDFTLVIKTDNSLWACGNNGDGQLGDGTKINKSSLVKITDDVQAISAGGIIL